ncbi:MAG: DNA-directed RNA polymerase subunit B [Candidatus Woesearchaeota archaeon]
MVNVFMDEKFIGNVDDSEKFVRDIRNERRAARLPPELNIYYNKRLQEIHIETSKGRTSRPVIIVENGKSKLTDEILERCRKNEIKWSDLIKQGIVEYLDSSEEENALIAINEKDITEEYTHLEISPSVILGFVTSLVPYANFGQSSRLNRGSKTQKQSLGIYATNYLIRMDTDVSILHSPQVPIVKTFMHDISNYENHAAGQNIVVALMSYQGYNMQDAIVVNKGSVDRGFARSTYFRPYGAVGLRYSGGLMDEIGIPDKEVKGYRSEKDYKLLEDDGVIYPEAAIAQDEVMIGKTSPPRFLGELEEFSIAASTRRESSVAVKRGEDGVVDMVVLTENEEGNRLVQVRVRQTRVPEIGDKFASRHGQKGVIGMIVPESDMPFTSSGVIPDIVFSPHSVPSRMTISHLIEVAGGKVGAMAGRFVDGTTFGAESEEDLRKELKDLGFREDGKETMYNGITGEVYKADIFIGSMYYLKLKHMVANKLHARASGRIQLLTRQPIEGRSKGGGLRLGEMEKDCFVAHGASLLLKERFDSDKTVVHVCEECGMLAVVDDYRNKRFCTGCGGNVDIIAIEISYAFKLLLDELKALCVLPKLNLVSRY